MCLLHCQYFGDFTKINYPEDKETHSDLFIKIALELYYVKESQISL